MRTLHRLCLLALMALSLGAVLAPLVAGPAFAVTRNARLSIMAITEVATGAPVTVNINNIDHAAGYLSIKTENETSDASLVVTVFNKNPLGDILICTTSAITTEKTTVIMLGHWTTAAAGIDEVCAFPMAIAMAIVFTTSGGGADFDVTASMEFVDPGV